ncbi:lipopolysaccharide biosynthesis protein [Rufibacter immobilis]|uniref:lipopolysaccharide biosynthesis protein n=1 Tax=Rufibacter immobilis TaxID=1348778 RepID=UPI0035EA3876
MLKGIFWDLFEKISNQGISFFISILLARLLSPGEFGLLGMVLVLVSMSQIFLDMGLSAAIIQRQDLTPKHYSSVFYLNLGIGILLSITVFFSAGFIADFYDKPALLNIFKVFSVIFIVNALAIVQNAQFAKDMNFKIPALIRVVATIVGGSTGVWMAYHDYGIWSLVTQYLLSTSVFVSGIWIVSKWRPGWQFDFGAVKDLWGFSSKLFASGVLDAIFTRMDVVVIGKLFSANTLGFYTRAQTMNNMVVQYSSGSLARVFFPAISRIQSDTEQVRILYAKAINLVSFLVFMLLGLLFLCAEDIFVLLFTEKWLPSVKYFQILVLGGYVYPLSSIMLNVLSGRGKSGRFLKLEILKKALLVIGLVVGFSYGIEGYLYSLAVVYVFSLLLNMYFLAKEIHMTIKKQLKNIVVYLVIALFSVVVVYFIEPNLSQIRIWHLLLTGTTFMTTYLGICLITKPKAITFLANQYYSRIKKPVI